MIKFAKVINEETGLCTVGTGTNNAFYLSMGMQPLDVQQSDIDGFWYLKDKCPMKTEEEKAEEERARINMLMLTGADVERAIYKDCGMDFEDVVALLETKYADVIDVKAVKIELKANNFYRGNPYVVQIGTLLGYSSDDMDYLFEHKKLPTKEDEGIVKDNLTVDGTTEETSAVDEE